MNKALRTLVIIVFFFFVFYTLYYYANFRPVQDIVKDEEATKSPNIHFIQELDVLPKSGHNYLYLHSWANPAQLYLNKFYGQDQAVENLKQDEVDNFVYHVGEFKSDTTLQYINDMLQYRLQQNFYFLEDLEKKTPMLYHHFYERVVFKNIFASNQDGLEVNGQKFKCMRSRFESGAVQEATLYFSADDEGERLLKVAYESGKSLYLLHNPNRQAPREALKKMQEIEQKNPPNPLGRQLAVNLPVLNFDISRSPETILGTPRAATDFVKVRTAFELGVEFSVFKPDFEEEDIKVYDFKPPFVGAVIYEEASFECPEILFWVDHESILIPKK